MNKTKKIITYCVSLLLIAILVVADQLSKFFIMQNIPEHTSVVVLNNWLYFTHAENTGAAFSILSGKQIFFIVLTIVLLLAIVFLYFKTPFEKKYSPLRCIIVVISGGAIGNLIDRIAKGEVTDFVDTRLVYNITQGKYNFPIYNFADICITLSMVVLIILVLFKYKDHDFDYLKPKKKEKKTFTDTEVYTISKNKETKKPEIEDVDEDVISEDTNEQ